MPDKAFQALKVACRHQIDWLQALATKYEQGTAQHADFVDGVSRDQSAELAEQFRHQANNLQAVINAYERLRASGS